MSFIIIKIWFVILVILLETTWKNPLEVLVKALQGVEDSYTYLTLSLPLSQWNDSVTWSTLCRKCVLYTTPPSEKLSYANVTVKKRERGSRDSNAEGYGTKWNCDFGLLQSSVIWVSFKSTIIKMVQGSFEIFCLTFLL